jgi:hypothetical protein
MNFYIVLGKSGHPIANQLFTKTDIQKLAEQRPDSGYSYVSVEVPWANSAWSRVGGQGKSAYPKDMEVTTMRVPKDIAYEVQKYAVWLAQQYSGEVAE